MATLYRQTGLVGNAATRSDNKGLDLVESNFNGVRSEIYKTYCVSRK